MRARRAPIATVVLAALGGALLLGGCGDDQSDAEQTQAEAKVESAAREAQLKSLLKVKLAERRRRQEHPGQTLAPARYSDALAARYEADREICSAFSPSELAASLNIDEDSDPEAIARAYSKSYPGKYEEPSFEGCLAGFE